MEAWPGGEGTHCTVSGNAQIGQAQTWAKKGFMKEVLPGPPLLGQIRWQQGAKS